MFHFFSYIDKSIKLHKYSQFCYYIVSSCLYLTMYML